MLRKIISAVREFGVRDALLYATDRSLQYLSSDLRLYVYDLMVQPISDTALVPARFTKRLELREIKRGDPELLLMPAEADIKESRFEQNARCLGAFQNGQFIGYIWLCFSAYQEDEVRCTYLLKPAREAVFDFDLYVFPEHRLGLAFVGIWSGVNHYLRERGIKYTFSRLTRFNVASRRAHDHLGWRLVAKAVFIQAWRFELMLATIFPYLHFSLGKNRRALLTLTPDSLLARK